MLCLALCCVALLNVAETFNGTEAVFRVTDATLQPGTHEVLCLLPSPSYMYGSISSQPRGLLILLPSAIGRPGKFGDPLLELRALDYHQRQHVAACVPTFASAPWLAEQPEGGLPIDQLPDDAINISFGGQPALRQRTYLLEVVHMLRKRLLLAPSARVSLLGFSKSGWSAC